MGIINRLPLGLLSLLDSQNQGVNPTALGEVVAPTIDQLAFLVGARGLSMEEDADNTLVIGDFGIVTIPVGEAWLVFGVGSLAVALDTTPGEVITINPGVRLNSSAASFMPMAQRGSIVTTDSTGESAANGVMLPQPICFPSGVSFCTQVGNVATVVLGWSVQTQVLCCKLKV